MRELDVPKRILVCGSRDWNDRRIIRQILLVLRDPWQPDQTVIHGDAAGADSKADRIARILGYKVRPYPANWDAYGRSAGPRRNQQMLEEGKPEIVYAFTTGLCPITRGTSDMIKRAKKAGIPTYVIAKP